MYIRLFIYVLLFDCLTGQATGNLRQRDLSVEFEVLQKKIELFQFGISRDMLLLERTVGDFEHRVAELETHIDNSTASETKTDIVPVSLQSPATAEIIRRANYLLRAFKDEKSLRIKEISDLKLLINERKTNFSDTCNYLSWDMNALAIRQNETSETLLTLAAMMEASDSKLTHEKSHRVKELSDLNLLINGMKTTITNTSQRLSTEMDSLATRHNETNGAILSLTARMEVSDLKLAQMETSMASLKTKVSNLEESNSQLRNSNRELQAKLELFLQENVSRNLALNKAAQQSSDTLSRYFRKENAVDGSTKTDRFSSSCIQTLWDGYPWWQVDLGSSSIVNRVTILNRGDCCWETLVEIVVRVRETEDEDSSWQDCGRFDGPGQAGQLVEITCRSPLLGQIVRIQKDGFGYLTFCEVSVYSR